MFKSNRILMLEVRKLAIQRGVSVKDSKSIRRKNIYEDWKKLLPEDFPDEAEASISSGEEDGSGDGRCYEENGVSDKDNSSWEDSEEEYKEEEIKSSTEEVCVICRQFNPPVEGISNFGWVECDGECNRWFHNTCVGLGTKEVEQERWFCESCGIEN